MEKSCGPYLMQNSNIELVEGNVIQSGNEVMSIIPENDSDYKANIYVSNENIGRLIQNMQVKFEYLGTVLIETPKDSISIYCVSLCCRNWRSGMRLSPV